MEECHGGSQGCMDTWTILQTDLGASAATCSVQEKSTAFSLHIFTCAWLLNM